jgi:hypothetical protein
MHDIAVLNDVLFSFDGHFAGFAAGRFRTVQNIVIIFNDFGANETVFKV